MGWEGKYEIHKSIIKEMYLEIFHNPLLLQINQKNGVMAQVGICCGCSHTGLKCSLSREVVCIE